MGAYIGLSDKYYRYLMAYCLPPELWNEIIINLDIEIMGKLRLFSSFLMN